jgi:hypothetical protein
VGAAQNRRGLNPLGSRKHKRLHERRNLDYAQNFQMSAARNEQISIHAALQFELTSLLYFKRVPRLQQAELLYTATNKQKMPSIDGIRERN